MTDTVHDDWIEAFNRAAHLARELEEERALKEYRALIRRVTPTRPTGEALEFLTTAKMRAAFCLMDLGRHEQALALLDDAARTIDALDDDEQYELLFARGNVLGNLGRCDEMFGTFVAAISKAEDLGDYVGRPSVCWSWVLHHAAKRGAWDFVADKAAIALNTARLRGIDHLATVASARLDEARAAVC